MPKLLAELGFSTTAVRVCKASVPASLPGSSPLTFQPILGHGIDGLLRIGKVNALYQFEVLASPRGKLWYPTRFRARARCTPNTRVAHSDRTSPSPPRNSTLPQSHTRVPA